MKVNTKKRGFTLVELSLAIAFISILLLTIATVTNTMVNDYHRGMTVKDINTNGLALINEFSSAISESPIFDKDSLCKSLGNIGTFGNHDGDDTTKDQWYNGENGADACMNEGAQKFIYQQYSQEIHVSNRGGVDGADIELPTFGFFCTGKYTYIWNTGYVVSQDGSSTMSSSFYSSGRALKDHEGNIFRLIKVADPNYSICRNNFAKNDDDSYIYTLKDADKIELTLSNPVELIHASDLAVYSITINSPLVNDKSGRALFTGSFVLGSISGDIDLNVADGKEGDYSSCNYENTSSFDVEYCATNKFNFATRAMGGSSEN